MKWTRITPFESVKDQTEIWVCKDSETEQKYDVHVTLGKPIDILSLKADIVKNFAAEVKQKKDSRKSIFKSSNLEKIEKCPVCKSSTKDLKEALTIHGASYGQCENCSHYFIVRRPKKEVIEKFYEENSSYQNTYADKHTAEIRVKQIATPHANWVIEQFKRVYGRKPKSILDVGAGSGHFVYACRELGMRADGVELSKKGIEFCNKNFNIKLIKKDFLQEWKNLMNYDIITFWGVIEHVPDPVLMLHSASKALPKEGLVVAEVPRWNCLSTTIQSLFRNSVVRHFDVMGHINVFTDSSLATAFKINNFDIVAVWYHGMDIYELLMQISYLPNEENVIKKMSKFIPDLQERLDSAKLSDEMIFIGKPSR